MFPGLAILSAPTIFTDSIFSPALKTCVPKSISKGMTP